MAVLMDERSVAMTVVDSADSTVDLSVGRTGDATADTLAVMWVVYSDERSADLMVGYLADCWAGA